MIREIKFFTAKEVGVYDDDIKDRLQEFKSHFLESLDKNNIDKIADL